MADTLEKQEEDLLKEIDAEEKTEELIPPQALEQEPTKEEPPVEQKPIGFFPPPTGKSFEEMTPDDKISTLEKRLSDTQRSMHGRQSQLITAQKQIDHLQAQLQTLTKKKDEDDVDEDTKQWEQTPGFNKAVERRMKKEVEPILKEVGNLKLALTINKLDSTHSDWLPVVKSEEYSNWLMVQDEATQALHTSEEVKDNIKVLSRYKESAIYTQLTAQQKKKQEQAIKQKAAMSISGGSKGVPPSKIIDDGSAQDKMSDKEFLKYVDQDVLGQGPPRESRR